MRSAIAAAVTSRSGSIALSLFLPGGVTSRPVSLSKTRKLKITMAAQIVKETPAHQPKKNAPTAQAPPIQIARVRMRRRTASSAVTAAPVS